MISNSDKKLSKYDPKRLAELARSAIGDRSVSAFCQQTNLSRSFVSRIVNAKLNSIPAKRTLARFAGAATNPQNGVTLKDLLIAAGYDVCENDVMDISIYNLESNKCLNLSERIQQYYTQTPAFCLNLLLNVLISKGFGTSYYIDFKPGVFSLTTKLSNSTSTKIIGIPAFCNDNTAITSVQVAALTSLVSAINTYPVSESIIFVITDNSQLYDKFIDTLPVLPQMQLSVLHTNEHYDGFSKQQIVSPQKSDTKKTKFDIIRLIN